MTTYIGTTSSDSLTGGTGNDVLIGKSGDDTLNGDAGSDILLGGAGSDIIYYDEFDIKIDGGTGYDMLIFCGTAQTLNLGQQKTVMNFERIDFSGGGGHTLTLSAADVLRISDLDSLLIHGTNSGTVYFSDGGWVFQEYSGGQSRFVNGSAIVFIDSAVNIDGFSNNATLSLGSGSATEVTEDQNPDSDNMLIATGTIVVTDPNAGQALLDLTGFDGQGTWGTLTLQANGSYTYTVSNAGINEWNNNRKETDVFTIHTVDGSVGSISFNIQGKNDAPTINSGTFTMDVYERPAELNSDGTVKENFYIADGSAFVTDFDNATQGDVFAYLASVSGVYGDMTATVTFAPDIQTFIVTWSVFFQESMFDHLKSGDNQALEYMLSIYDANGSSTTQTVSVKIHGADDPIVGTSAADTLPGTTSNDLMSGLDENDIISGHDGDDTIYGGVGDDILNGGYGDDTIHGGDGSDIISGNQGTNFLIGGDGNDRFAVNESEGSIDGGAGSDYFEFLGTWGLSGLHPLMVTGGAGLDWFEIHVDSLEYTSFGISITDFNPGDDSVLFSLPSGISFEQFGARQDSDDTVTVTFSSGGEILEICSLTFPDGSLGLVGPDWLLEMALSNVIIFP